MKHFLLIECALLLFSLLLFASCGQQYRAQSVAKDFMAQQLNKADADYLDFSDVDSTHSISDSLVDVLRRRGPKGISYLDRKGRILLYIRAKYLDGQDTCSTTFYLDSEATGVVAFKDN